LGIAKRQEDSMHFDPNGRNFFRKTLPKSQSECALALREYHWDSSHIHFLETHMPELAKDHNLGTLVLEYPPFMMLFFWAHRDGRLGKTRAEADDILKNALIGVSDHGESGARSALISAAHASKVDVIAPDARQLFEPKLKECSSEVKFVESHPSWSFWDFSMDQQLGWALVKAEEIYEANPDYARRLNAIEHAITVLRSERIPKDVITATLATCLAKPKSNMIAIYGAAHIGGIDNRKLSPRGDISGIFDNALARQGWNVTDAIIGSKKEVEEQIDISIRYRDALLPEAPGNYDLIDGIYLTDQDKFITGFVPPKRYSQSVTGYLRTPPIDTFSNTLAPPVDALFRPWELNPALKPRTQKILETLQEALNGVPSQGHAGKLSSHRRTIER
jgi:hypothetical protein